MPRWTLQYRGVVLGMIEEIERDMWNVRGTFAATAACDAAIASLFATKDALASRLEDDDNEALVAEFDAVEEQASPPHFELIGEDARVQAFGFLYLSATSAGFRLVEQ